MNDDKQAGDSRRIESWGRELLPFVLPILIIFLFLSLSLYAMAQGEKAAPVGFLAPICTGIICGLAVNCVVQWLSRGFHNKLETMVGETREICKEMRKRPIRITDNRALAQPSDFYHPCYRNALDIRIAAVTCKGFFKDLYPGYWIDGPLETDDDDDTKRIRTQRLKDLEKFPLIRRLRKSNLHTKVFFVRHDCAYAQARGREDGAGGKERLDKSLEEVRGAIEAMAEDLRYAFSNRCPEATGIRGQLEFFLIDKNPYVSVFMWEERGTQHMHVGPLTQGRRGDTNPVITLSTGIDGNQDLLVRAYSAHLEALGTNAQLIFRWQGQDVFFENGKKRVGTSPENGSGEASQVTEDTGLSGSESSTSVA